MSGEFEIRGSSGSDATAIERLYQQAFPDEDLVPLIRELMQEPAICISLVAAANSEIVGHTALTTCDVTGCSASAALLGPVAVAPAWQRRSVGRGLVRFGLQRLKTENVAVVCVLGDPAYYSRLGFAPEVHVEPPFQLPREWADAWQSKCLDEAAAPCVGKLAVPPPWMRRDLWAP